MTPRRGEVWVANLNLPRGREMGKIRPVLVIQANELTATATPVVVVLHMTTRVYPGFRKWRVRIPARDRLLKECQIVTDQPRALDRKRFGDGPLTVLNTEEMTVVERSLQAVLGMW